jgi:hypothetical protein
MILVASLKTQAATASISAASPVQVLHSTCRLTTVSGNMRASLFGRTGVCWCGRLQRMGTEHT